MAAYNQELTTCWHPGGLGSLAASGHLRLDLGKDRPIAAIRRLGSRADAEETLCITVYHANDEMASSLGPIAVGQDWQEARWESPIAGQFIVINMQGAGVNPSGIVEIQVVPPEATVRAEDR